MFEECLFVDTLHSKTIFNYIIEKQQILNALIEKMSDLNQDDLPFLMFKDRNNETYLDILVEKEK